MRSPQPFVATFALMWLLTWPPSPTTRAVADSRQVETATLALQSGGKSIPVDRYRPAGSGKLPAVILVHGADGLQFEPWVKIYQGMADRIARHGCAVYIPHYFQRTDAKFGDAGTIARQFVPWMGTISDTVEFVRQQPDIQEGRIGLVGVSLGATLALSVGATNTKVQCVVEFFGGTPDWLPPLLGKMPPTLILHGTADRLVKIDEAYKLEKALQAKQRVYEIKVYPGQGHGFNGTADVDALERTNIFLERYLLSAETGPRSNH